MTDAEERDWWRDRARRRMDECQRLTTERDRLQAELAEVRRLLLPHPDAEYDDGCGCDMYDAVSAAAWAGAEMRRLVDEVRRLRAEVAALGAGRGTIGQGVAK